MLSRTDVLGVSINQITRQELLHKLYHQYCNVQKLDTYPTIVSFVNAQSLVTAKQDILHKIALSVSDFCIADGWPIAKLAKTEKISGPDFMLDAARHPGIGRLRHVLLGGEGVAYKAALTQFFASPSCVGAPWIPGDGEWFLQHPEQIPECDFLWVSLGCPKQERWMMRNRFNVRCSVMLGVGAAFDFLAGEVQRAPVWMQRSGLECLHRIYTDPKRWRRQVGSILGLIRLLIK